MLCTKFSTFSEMGSCVYWCLLLLLQISPAPVQQPLLLCMTLVTGTCCYALRRYALMRVLVTSFGFLLHKLLQLSCLDRIAQRQRQLSRPADGAIFPDSEVVNVILCMWQLGPLLHLVQTSVLTLPVSQSSCMWLWRQLVSSQHYETWKIVKFVLHARLCKSLYSWKRDFESGQQLYCSVQIQCI